MKMTIKEIAKLAGVSQATVSKIINNYSDVGEKTKKKVLNIMDEHGYRPSYSAQSLAKNVTNVIGVIYAGKINAQFNHPYFVEVVSSFKKTIGLNGYDLLFFSNERFHKGDENYLARCAHYNVDGCIIIGGDDVEPSIYDLDRSTIPCMGVDIELKGERSSYIMTDNNKVSSLTVEHFYMQGHREIAFIGGNEGSMVTEQRLHAFKNAMTSYGIPIREEWILTGDYFEESGYKAMKKLLAFDKVPSAIFAISDLMAIGALQAVKDEGLNVEDFSIIGCDDIIASQYVDPPLTTVRQNKEKLGKIAALMLTDIIKDKLQPSFVKVEPELIIRKSCKAKKIST
ncbi:LacI family transcriptional regulator [Salipaludibacillus neizhouensis]|uniref:LacI family transcriptional regulator n=1 Tax=Salipaludibacillus neizhouensis TaxID=885475 RepID=A0A3A9K5Z4_9BACI|nr:LacI family DNA-binding transcriptional regulator [Salipaludibacillus neizhouensis]RKL66828.1 LacI family transcriptional regulator [Salipaludibacillus neizhouensis]